MIWHTESYPRNKQKDGYLEDLIFVTYKLINSRLWVQILSLPLTSCRIHGKYLKFFMPQFPHLLLRKIKYMLQKFTWVKLNGLIHLKKYLKQYLAHSHHLVIVSYYHRILQIRILRLGEGRSPNRTNFQRMEPGYALRRIYTRASP